MNELWSAQALQDAELPELEWTVEGWLAEGLGLLIGKPKAGKSWLLFQLAIAVASGEPFLGMATHQGDVLLLALEDGRRRLKTRLELVLGGRKAPERLSIASVESKWGRSDNGGHDKILQWLSEAQDARLIAIDTLGRFRALNTPQRNAYMADLAALEPLQSLALRLHLPVVFAHHDNKNLGSEDWVYGISGTQAVAGTADTLIGLSRRPGSEFAILKAHGRDTDERDLLLKLHSGFSGLAATVSWRPLGLVLPGATLTVEREKVVRVLAAFGEPMTIMEVVRRLGDEVEASRKLVQRMVSDGLLEKSEKGVSLIPLSHLSRWSTPTGLTGHTGHRTEGTNGTDGTTYPYGTEEEDIERNVCSHSVVSTVRGITVCLKCGEELP